MADNKKIAQDVLQAVGGKDNVTSITHCMTRLRFNLKDQSLPKDDEVKQLDGVLGVVRSGGQYQVVIGQNVPKVYAEMCSIGGFAAQAAVDENLDAPKKKLTAKDIGNNILNYMAGSMTPLIPVIIAAAMFKTLIALFGPELLGLFTAESDMYILLDFVYDAGFYFLPIYLGYTAAKKLNASPVLGMFMGGILLSPDFAAIAAAGTPFSVLGIPVMVNSYAQSVLPILLSVWVLAYVEKFFKKVIPDTLSTVFVPFLTMLVMVPVSLCALAPLGAFLGQYISAGLLAFGDFGGFVALALIAALWNFLVISGMHTVLVLTAITMIMTEGCESLILVAGGMATFATFGMALGSFLRLRNKKEKALSLGYFISGIVGGVTEPALYGIGFKYKRPFIGMVVGAALGGAYAGLMGVTVYMMTSSNVLFVLAYSGVAASNFIHGTIASAISLISAAVVTYLIGFSKEDLEEKAA